MLIGEEIKQYRSSKKLTQEEFAVMIHISQSRLAKFETNKAGVEFDIVVKIAEVFEDGYLLLTKWHERLMSVIIQKIILCKNKIQK